ncbi:MULTISPECIES: hypothetical protein [Natrialbaceae]|uniref:hypothetical protein n=1 Tax=Natrialbaceae TaxID=1644061 RepID=UPI00207C7F85|nr:hypothetical protein [Natronococcus sp. CG52]
MKDIEYTDNELEIGGESVVLPGPIQNIVTIDDLIIVLFRPPDDEASGRNIRAFDRSGTEQWSVEPATMPTRKSYRYTGLRMEGDELWAYNWKGGDYRIDPSTGKIEDSKLSK